MKINEVKPTKEQDFCINFSDNKDLVVRGVAGSGKSLVIIKRAVKLAKMHLAETPKILIVTFTKSLVHFTEELRDTAPEVAEYIQVQTADSVLMPVAKKALNIRMAQFHQRNNFLDRMLNAAIGFIKRTYPDNRFLQPEMKDWLLEEIVWIIRRKAIIPTAKAYMECKRIGRGVSVKVDKDDRNVIYSVYERYMASAKLKNWESIYAELGDNPQKITDDMKYDYILVDECQDLGLSKLKCLKNLTRKSLTLSADFAQKIYKSSGFTWKEVGVDVKGQASRKLNGSFRNTKQIFFLAESLKKNNNVLRSLADENLQADIPDREGPVPMIHCLKNREEEKDFCCNMLNMLLEKCPGETAGIILPTNRSVAEWGYILDEHGIDYEVVKDKDGSEYNLTTPGIKLVTYHSSKGLEFDNVFLPRVDSDKIPSFMGDPESDQKNDIVDEWRSLMYVGMTRARLRLQIFCCRNAKDKPSVLLGELDKDYFKSDGY